MDPYLITYVVAGGRGGERGDWRLPGGKAGVFCIVNVSADDEKAGRAEKKIKTGFGIFHQCPTRSVRPSRPQTLIKGPARDVSSSILSGPLPKLGNPLAQSILSPDSRGIPENETPARLRPGHPTASLALGRRSRPSRPSQQIWLSSLINLGRT